MSRYSGAFKEAWLWDVKTGERRHTLLHPSGVTAIDWSSDGKFVITGCTDNKIRIWSVETGEMSLVSG